MHNATLSAVVYRVNSSVPSIVQLIPSTILMVLGRQKLTDLRDMIRCVHDLTVAGDASENPDADCHNYAKVYLQ